MSEAREIPIGRGMVAIVDATDYDALSAFSWHAWLNGKVWYAVRRIQIRPRSHPDGQGHRTIMMHRAIMDARPEQRIDHINHNGLDNRRANLRFCNKAQNAANSLRSKRGYRGISQRGQQWAAYISNYPACPKYLGIFQTQEAAARAYDAAALARFGEFASLNFPHGVSP